MLVFTPLIYNYNVTQWLLEGIILSKSDLNYNPSLQTNTLAEQAAQEELRKTENFDTLRKCYVNLMNQLLIDGVPREKVSTVGQKIIIEKKRNIRRIKGASEEEIQKIQIGRWWYDIAREENFTDPKFSHSVATDTERENSSLNTKEGKFYNENRQLITRLDDFVEKTNMLRKYANDHKFLSLVPKDILEDVFTRLDAYCKNFTDYMNNKQTVPENTQLIFLQQYNACSDINNLFGLYFDEIKRIHLEDRKNTKKTNQILTPKELKKFLARELVSLSKILDFASPNQARLHGFYGQQCPRCQGFRTKIQPENQTKVICIKCHNLKDVEAFDREYFVTCKSCKFVYDDKQIKDECPHCGLPVVIPVEISS